MAERLVSERDVDRKRHAVVSERAREGGRSDPVHSLDHELGRQFRITGDLAHYPGFGPARAPAAGLVAYCATRAPCRDDAGSDSRLHRHRSNYTMAARRILRLRTVLGSHRADGWDGARGDRDLWINGRVHVAFCS